ncbi:MAG: HAD family hydrolase, partial [Nannocystaceae bacterium]
AFFRAEGVILSRGVMASSAYLASNAQRVGERVLRLGFVALTAPVHGLLGQNDRTLATRLAHLAFRNMTEDRIAELSEEYTRDILADSVLDQGRELLKRARKQGHRIVLLSDNLASIMEPLCTRLELVDDLVCNHLEYRDRRATGKLCEPVVGGHGSGRWLRDYAAQHDIDLSRSLAYGAHGPDLLMLSAVGNPCAVNPDYTLRRSAREADWPIIDYRE